jgi:hypothetical protein
MRKWFPQWSNTDSWSAMFVGTNAILAPHKTCDCFRNDAGYQPGNVFTNRYYVDAFRKVYVTYINFGWNFEFCQGRLIYSICFNSSIEGLWKYPLPFSFQFHLKRLTPRPSIIVLNAGLFKNEFNNETYAKEIVKAAHAAFPRLRIVWRTITFIGNIRKRSQYPPYGFMYADPLADEVMCKIKNVTCFDISWTKHLPFKYYLSDAAHFKTPVYNWFNRQLWYILFRNNSVVTQD